MFCHPIIYPWVKEASPEAHAYKEDDINYLKPMPEISTDISPGSTSNS